MIKTSRLLRLSPWIIKAVIPQNIIGNYILYTFKNGQAVPIYVGRSDIDLKNRLLQHAYANKAEYFEFIVQKSSKNAFELECALFHALEKEIINKIHPDMPNGKKAKCPFCLEDLNYLNIS